MMQAQTAFAAGPEVNPLDYPGPAWSPYVVGAGIGVLSWLTFYISDKPIGPSSFYAEVAGFIGKLFVKRHTASLAYFKENPPQVGWGFAFVLSTIVGGGPLPLLLVVSLPTNGFRPCGKPASATTLRSVRQSPSTVEFSWPLVPGWPEAAPAATASAERCNLAWPPRSR